ncbi:MAG: helix-turn-helix domain-containing protein [Candidatus Eremiobacteraeota bacterium]|nr:helix-turn-helix domain-containing protein [Candidatus Eremiobacteraeota bacterium]
MTVRQAAEALKIPPRAVRALLAAGHLRGSKRRGAWQIESASVERFLAPSAPAPRPAGEYRPVRLSQQREQALARDGSCPVCLGDFRDRPGASSFSEEFLSCQDCGFSLHENFLGHPNLSKHARLHLEKLETAVIEGQRVRQMLDRRQVVAG